ncbi:MAG: branched-chain amino acid ABC transporter permease [Elusimicrobia bacterium]|nr:branched-chain amino acid ABC transporter permease [Elusimicrobiota bacterium]
MTPVSAAKWAGLAAILVVPALLGSGNYAYLVQAGGMIGLYMILALGLNFTMGYVGLFDLGYIAFFAAGAYGAAICGAYNVPLLIELPLTVAFAVLLRLGLGVSILRLRGDYLAIVTMGFGEITRLVINNLDSITNGPKGMEVPPLQLFSWTLSGNLGYYYLIAACVALGVIGSRRLEDSRVGRAWVAIREDETAARLSGISVNEHKLLAFTISAGFAAVAGMIFAHWIQFVTPESFVFWESILIVSMIVLGGMGSIYGVLLGALILGGVPQILQVFLAGSKWIDYRYFFFGVVLVVVVLFRPEGLWPHKRRQAELHEEAA